MKTLHRTLMGLFAGLLLAGGVQAAETGVHLEQSGVDLTDRASLQRGARYYMSYCSGCHSLKYQRYSRIGEDLGLTEDEIKQNFIFKEGTQIGGNVLTGMDAELGKTLFGKAPPDLSVISRVRGNDWIYTYLKSFYLDESRPLGWNNPVFPNASMPNPLWELQGLQHAELGAPDATGERHVERLVVTSAGVASAADFDQGVRDITNFLEYAGEPAALKRQAIGVWVILFLVLLTFLAYLLKQEYWTDVH